MSTNFYWRRFRSSRKVRVWSADYSIKRPPEQIQPEYIQIDSIGAHIGKRSASAWKCKTCGRAWDGEKFRSKSRIELHNGCSKPDISTGCSFLWAENPSEAIPILLAYSNYHIVINEYGALFTGKEFLNDTVLFCDIQKTSTVGSAFS